MRATIFLITLLLLCASSLYALDKDGLVLYLPLDDKMTKDISGNGNDAILQGDAEWVEGKFGTAVHLPVGKNYVEVPHDDSLTMKQNLTMEIWAKIDSLPGSCSLITKCTDGFVGNYMLHVAPAGDAAKIDPLVFIGNDYGAWPTPVNVTIPLGEWHHVAATYDGEEYNIYIDGELEGNYARVKGGELDESEAFVAIGRDNRGAYLDDRSMDCTVDEVRIWNRVLSQDEIKEAITGVLLSVDPVDLLTATWGHMKARF
jgi:hypothetical protein